jgi:hypothetical protein
MVTDGESADTVSLDPAAFTSHASVEPTWAADGTYVGALAPAMGPPADPDVSHWYEKLDAPLQVPGLQVSVEPTSGLPPIDGAAEL